MRAVLIGGASIASAGLGILGLVLVGAVFAGRSLPYISEDRAAFIALAIIGFAMCTLSPLRKLWNWADPVTLVAAALGVLALALVAAVLTSRAVPLIPDARGAIVALAILIATKVGLAALHRLMA